MTAVRARASRAGSIWSASLGRKLLLILAAVALTGAVALTLLLTAVIMPSFTALEHRAIAGQVDRVRATLARYGAEVEDASLATSGEVSGTRSFRRADGRSVLIDPDTPPAFSVMARDVPLDRIAREGRVGHAFIRVGQGLAAIGVARGQPGEGGDAGGYRVAIRLIDAGALRRALGPSAHIVPPVSGGPVATMDVDWMRVAVPVAGPGGTPVAALEIRSPRDLAMLGRHVLWLAVAAMTILLVIVLAVLRRLIAVLVLRPIGKVEAHMQRVRDSGAFAPLPVDSRQHDEIASLGNSFNSMLAQLKDLSERVEAQSFALGRTESAVAVMHNVRNALTPVTTILGTSLQRMEPADRRMVRRALDELADDAAPPERRARLVEFVMAAIDVDDRMRADGREQLRIGRDAMNQVLEIIGAQQAQAHARPSLETCDATQIVAQNAVIARHAADGTSIAISFPARPHPVVANRLLLSQVIGNLLSNAADAIEATGGAGSIAVTVDDLPEGLVAITIRDDGEGFDSATRAKLFQRGYSTRAHKSGGLGLHWCANSMAAMGGSLRLESEGVGRGAVAHLTLSAPADGESQVGLAA